MQRTMYKASPVDPKALSTAARDALSAELFAVQQEIFAGVDEAAFRAYVIDSPAQRTRIEVYRADGPTGAAVGYSAVHTFELVVDGVKTMLLRAEVGLLPAWRGRTAAGRIITTETIRAMLQNPFGRTCFLACPVHPASYLCMARTSKAVWPRPEAATPKDVAALMTSLDTSLGLQRPRNAGAFVRKVGWITRQGRDEEQYWADHDSDLVRFYVEQNPSYTRGDGLIVVVSISLAVVLDGISAQVRRQLRRSWKRVQKHLTGSKPAPILHIA